MNMMTAIIPDPDSRGSGFPRSEIHGDDPAQLQGALKEHLAITGYTKKEVGLNFSVYRDGVRVASICYDGEFYWADPLYNPANRYHMIEVTS